jgi:peptidoglycan/xylan/chitin deacetylase (PgdA/CDA1 family)
MNLYLTIDTELASGLYRTLGKAALKEILDRSIVGKTNRKDVGVAHQMDVLDRHGLKAVFFVDPMPALVFGVGVVRDIVRPILDRGHDVQLHLHSEWLKFLEHPLLGERKFNELKQYGLEDQIALVRFARETLIDAGAPPPIAFRAGNYSANDETLQALSANQIAYDTSFCTGIVNSNCDISLPEVTFAPVRHCGVIEVPIGAIGGPHGTRRHAQLTALSYWEMKDAFAYLRHQDVRYFSLVSHSFELMSRDRQKANLVVARRFEKLCAHLEHLDGVNTSTYRDDPPQVGGPQKSPASYLLPHRRARTLARTGEQAVSNLLYGSR